MGGAALGDAELPVFRVIRMMRKTKPIIAAGTTNNISSNANIKMTSPPPRLKRPNMVCVMSFLSEIHICSQRSPPHLHSSPLVHPTPFMLFLHSRHQEALPAALKAQE
jgi:hypothetical protein